MKKPPLPPSPASLKDHYRLLRRLGAGTFGEVWLAEAPGGVQVAIKRIFRAVSHAEGQRELKVLELVKNLRHPFLLATQAYWQEEEQLCIVMELADGSLRDTFKQYRRQGKTGLPAELVLGYMVESAEALDFLHERQVMHRDIKPENLLHLHGHIKVADFGLARESDAAMQSAATFCGTASYMPPETWRNQLSVHGDQYSLALSYVELRTGTLPFRGKGLGDLMKAHTENAPDLSLLPSKERGVLRKALAKDPDARYPSCQEFTDDLIRAAQPSMDTGSRRSRQTRRVTEPSGRRGWLKGLAGLGLVVGGVGVWHYWPEPEVKPDPVPPPPVERGWLPVDFRTEDAAPVPGGRLYSTIYTERDGVRFTFKLIPRLSLPDGERNPFYMLDDKVTIRQFRAVADTEEYQRLLLQAEQKQLNRKDNDPVGGGWCCLAHKVSDDCPVHGVTLTEAVCFAACLRCRLPSVEQWDRAGGRYDAGKPLGPAVRPGGNPANSSGIGVGRLKVIQPPAAVRNDVSHYGCRNMAGNGFEWTRTLADPGGAGREVPLESPRAGEAVIMRGASWTREMQFLFEESPLKMRYFEALKDFTFRVTLDIPADVLRQPQ